MLQVIYNSTPLWDYFIDNCKKKHNYAFIKLQKKQNIFASRNMLARCVNLAIGKYIDLGYRYIINGNFNQIANNDTILLLGIYNYAELFRLRKRFQSNKMVLWLWNPVMKTYRRNAYDVIRRLKSLKYEIFTFDDADAKEFNLGLRSQFTLIPSANLKDKNNIKYDTYFLGQPKGRLKILKRLEQIYTEMGIKYCFKIVNTPADYIPYEENIRNVSLSKSVLELCQEGQRGLTLRALEAMLCHRKLITNNKSIVEEDFYSPQNVFVIGKDTNENLKHFIDSDFVVVDDAILEKYDFNNWLEYFYYKMK